MGDVLGVAHAFCGQLTADDDPEISTTALFKHGEIVPNIRYELRHTPCDKVVGKSVCFYGADIQKLFPRDQLLVDLGAESYAGVPLYAADRKPLGVLVVLDTKPMDDPSLVQGMLQLLAVNAASELERAAYEQRLKASEARFRDFAESASDWLWEMDRDLRFSFFSKRVEDVTGVPVEFHLGKTRKEIAGEAINTEKWQNHLETLARREPFKGFGFVREGPGGRKQFLETSGIPIFGENGEFEGYRGTGKDVSELHANQEALRLSEERFQLAARHAPIWDWDLKADKVYFSPLFRDMLGYNEKEFQRILESTIKDIIHPDDLDVYLKTLQHHKENPDQPYESEHRFRLKSGEYRWFQARGQYSCDDDGKPVRLTGFLMDVTTRKRGEKALKDSLILLRTVLDANADYIYWKDRELVLLGGNRAFAEAAGLPDTDAIVGKTDFDLPWSREEAELYRESDRMVMETGEPLLNAVRTQRHADGRVMTIESSKYPLRDARGNVIGLVGTYRDITERIRIERELQDSMDRAEQANRSKSEFLASMSHELRTPLNAVLGYGQMLRLNLDGRLADSEKEYVEHILHGGNHLLELVNDILDLARVEADKLSLTIEKVNANAVVKACVAQSLQLCRAHNVELIDAFSDTKARKIVTDELRFSQIVINLLSNAIKYNRDKGTITIRGEKIDTGFLRLSVEDTGIGIPEEHRSQIFDIFQRAGADPEVAAEGTGIGLSVTKMLVERLGGRIDFVSQEGVGSTFWIDLPLASNKDVLIWSDPLRVGVDPIDRDHQVLVSLYNKLLHRSVDDADVSAIINELIDYTHYHFRREEALMEACGFPDRETHRKRHRSLTARVNKLALEWRDSNVPETTRKLRRLLGKWVKDHIQKSDTELVPYARDKELEIRAALREFG